MSETRTTAPDTVEEQQLQESQEQARGFLLALAQLLSVSRFHQLDNEAVRVLTGQVGEWTERLCVKGAKFRFFNNDGQVFVDSRRLRFSGGSYITIQGLLLTLERRGLAGMEIRAPLTAEKLLAFLEVFHRVPRDTADPAAFIERFLAEAKCAEIGVLRPGIKDAGEDVVRVADDIDLATLLYAKAVVLLRETVRNWENEEVRSYLGARSTRVIQGMISLAERNRSPFLWLVTVKSGSEYENTHGANVALLSILLGHRLGINRSRLCELGAAALYHDLGLLSVPGEARSEDGRFDDEARQAMARHPIHGVNLLLKLRKLNLTLLTRVAVVFEHNIASNGYPRKSWPRGLHIFSRIVAIADAYDAMTTRRPYRPARTPDEALHELRAHAGTRYDPDLVAVFVNMMGIYPLGTLVRLDTGELAIVFHVDPGAPRRPLVKVVRSPDGAPLADAGIVDLGERDGSGAYKRSITGTVDSVSEGINIPSYLWETRPA
jgi:HD-GYP domain-containing protein (c-di-GMP phosphodiesterase class II)